MDLENANQVERAAFARARAFPRDPHEDGLELAGHTFAVCEQLREAISHISALTKQVEEAREALKPFAERGRAEFTTGDYHNPDPAPESQIFGSELFLTVGDLRRATLVHALLSSGSAAKDDAQGDEP
jgi:hypothetical protein